MKRAVAAAEQAASDGAQIICTQELFRSQYFCQAEDHKFFELAEPIPGPTTAAFQKIAAEKQVVIIASQFEKRAAGLYHNTAVMIDARSRVRGSWSQDGTNITIRFENCVYQGRMQGGEFSGTAQYLDGDQSWTFQVALQQE